MRRHGGGGSTARTLWPRMALAVLGLPLLLAGWAAPAAAQAPAAGTTLTLARLWNQGGSAGTWTPYAITVRNDGSGTFTGTAVLLTDGGFSKGPPTTYPEYRAAVTVPPGSQ